MADVRGEYPTALTTAGEEPGLVDGIAWVLRTSRAVGGAPLVVVPAPERLDDSRWLRAFVRDSRVPVATPERPAAGWRGGAVLAVWPAAAQLAAVAADPRVAALCVVPGDAAEVADWARTARPRLLGMAETPARAPALDPVVGEALTTLSGLIDPAGDLEGAQARRDAVAVLHLVHQGGHPFDREEVYAWALAHGWPARAARHLAALAAHVACGQRPAPAAAPFRPEILTVWRERAANARLSPGGE